MMVWTPTRFRSCTAALRTLIGFGWFAGLMEVTALGAEPVWGAREHRDGGTEIEWTREGGPPQIVGWHVEFQEPNGQVHRLTESPVPVDLLDPPATVYRFHAQQIQAHAGDFVAFRLVSVDPELRERPEPFSVQRVEAVRREVQSESLRLVDVSKSTKSAATTTGQWVRIVVTNEGMVRLTASQLATVLASTTAAQVARAILQTNFSLNCGGTAVAWRAETAGSALYFFAQAPRDNYDDRGVYWLKPGRGLAMSTTNRSTTQVAADPWFWETTRVEENNAFMPYLPGTETNDYFVWTGRQLVTPAHSWQWTTRVPMMDRHPDAGTGMVTAHLASGYDGPAALDNRTLLYIGGALANDKTWGGDVRLTQIGTASLPTGETVDVTVEIRRPSDVTTTMVLVDAVEVRYGRRMLAHADQLLFWTRREDPVATVRGFASPNIRVMDVSNPMRPIAVEPTIAREGDQWRATWTVDPGMPRRYLATAAAIIPQAVNGVNDRGWTRRKTGARHLVIAPMALRSAANALVVHRKAQGVTSRLVPLEEIFDAFGGGRRDPGAIPRFLAHARTNWTIPPEYICLAGDGHVDYLDHFQQASTRPNHVPPMLSRLPYNAQASGVRVTIGVDNALADLTGDGRPEMAIGRLPAQTAAALTRMIERIKRHEADDAWKRRILLVSDRDGDDSFADVRDRVARRVVPVLETLAIGHDYATPVEAMRARWVEALNIGPVLAFYFGHANNIGLSSPYFFEHSYLRTHMTMLTNSVQGPVMVAGTCMLNDFAAPHPNNRCLGKGFLETATGGVVAVWASAAESTLGMAESVSGAMLDQLFSAKTNHLGDLIQTMLALQVNSVAPWSVRSSVLLGDPGMRVATRLALDYQAPSVRITRPLPAATYRVSTNRMDIAGIAHDSNGITRVVVRNHRLSFDYAASGTTNWTRPGVLLREGMNRISAIAYDAAGNSRTTSIRVFYRIHHRINCGQGLSAEGWQADTGGQTSSDGGARSTSTAISSAATVPQAVYRTWRQGKQVKYALNVPDGRYHIRLHFVESQYAAAGRRLFDVAMEGRTLISNFDIYKAAGGRHKAVRKAFSNVLVRGGLQIQLRSSAQQALVCGIEVWPASDQGSVKVPLKANSGGTAVQGWREDLGWKTSEDGRKISTSATIARAGSIPQEVYRTGRQGRWIRYDLAVPDGLYHVRMHFAEPTCTAPGQRIFNVAIEGRERLSNFDVFREAGGRHVAKRKAFAHVRITGGLQIRLSAVSGSALINGIEIWEAKRGKTTGTAVVPVPPDPPGGGDATMEIAARIGPRIEVRDGNAPWVPAPELADGDLQTVWTGTGTALEWAVAADLGERLDLETVRIVFSGEAWTNYSVLGTTDMETWRDLDQIEDGPVPCRALFIQLREGEPGRAPSIGELQWQPMAGD